MKASDHFIKPGIRRNKHTLSFLVTFIVSLSMLCACGDSNTSSEKGSGNAPTEAAKVSQPGDNGGSSDSDGAAGNAASAEGNDAAEAAVAGSTGESTTGASEGAVADAAEVEVAEATPTPKAGNNDKPTPTPKPAHVHAYTVTASVTGQDCRHTGTDTYTCSCGDSYTQDNGKYGDHVWTTETSYTTEVIHHDAEYKTETVWVCDCGNTFSSQSEAQNHYNNSNCGGYHSSSKRTVIKDAWDEEIQTPYTRTVCAVCGTGG